MRTMLMVSSALVIGLSQTGYGVAQEDQGNKLSSLSEVTDEMLLEPSDGDWLHWRRTYNGWGYSPLEEINRDNVGDLSVAWSWSLTPGATETTPIVHDGVLFVHNNLDKVQALDGATGDLLWEYVRDLPQEVIDAGNGNSATKRRMDRRVPLFERSADCRRHGDPGHDRVRQRPAGRVLYHRA